ncbi:Hypothetical predicted protein [Pelobates cultripes]|uniref:Uncharacterized protein n=2 Tax=Pelobates cultripes TaxID=61616 RepID=A0AAD1WHH8_PELCU|nr:Hypothetical predicted protein [Pelobates cultripes]
MTAQPYTRSVIPRLLNAAKTVIPIYWKQANTPPITRWLEEVETTRKFEDLMANTPKLRDRYTTRWFHWIRLTASNDFQRRLATR